MKIRISPQGNLESPYDESLDLTTLGPCSIHRAGTVEWNNARSPAESPSGWYVRFARHLFGLQAPLGPFAKRSDALAAERAWIDEHYLTRNQVS